MGRTHNSTDKTVAILDDHTMMREGLAALVEGEPGFTCAWTSGDPAEAFGLLTRGCPDLLTVDITLPGRNGLEFIKDALAAYPDLKILVVSMHDEGLYAQRVLRAGAKGYIMKDAPHNLLSQAVKTVSDGGVWVSPEMSAAILKVFSGGKGGDEKGEIGCLTDREFEVFQLIGEARSTNAIADALRISPKTVDAHRIHIREKLGLEDANAVVRYAIRWVESRRLGGT